MLFSKVLKGSPHCVASPNGSLIATLLPSSIAIRQVQTLHLVRSVTLPASLSGAVVSFAWSPSSTKVLLAVADQVQLFSALEDDTFQNATIRLATTSAAKPTSVSFGPADHEIFVFFTHGIKLSIFNLLTSSTIEIPNPKFYVASAVKRGLAVRPGSNHLALLTRTAGKDLISIHPSGSRELQRSWTADTVDAQALAWTSEGEWLMVWESAAHGHKLLFYTADGHLYKAWQGPLPQLGDVDLTLGAGIGLLKLSPNGEAIAVADSSRSVAILNTKTMSERTKITHPDDITPSDTLQVWQEQGFSQLDRARSAFAKAAQTFAPPPGPLSSEGKATSNVVAFDCSATLLATRMSFAPSTVWIWDLLSTELRAVLVYHSEVLQVQWHPKQPELLLMRCEPTNSGIAYVWDPLSQGPCPIEFGPRMKTRKVTGRAHVNWLDRLDDASGVIFADDTGFGLCLLADDLEETETAGWLALNSTSPSETDSFMSLQASTTRARIMGLDEEADDEHSEMDDTFHFKKA